MKAKAYEGLGNFREVRAELFAAYYEGNADRQYFEKLHDAEEATKWLADLKRINERGGAGLDLPPFSFRGTWRLAYDTNPDSEAVFKPVVWDEEKIPGVNSFRRVVGIGELAAKQCGVDDCGETVPLLGRSKVAQFNIGFRTTVAVVHCGKIQPHDPWEGSSAENDSRTIAFTPFLEAVLSADSADLVIPQNAQ